jgi:hypothetical protein
MPRPISVADKAIAKTALTEMFVDFSDAEGEPYPAGTAGLIADELLSAASRVKFQPSTRQLVMTIDLAFGQDTDTE